MGELRLNVEKAKEINITKFKDLDAYKLTLNTIATQFLRKERPKIRRLLHKHQQIEDLCCLARISFDDDEKKKREDGGEPRKFSKALPSSLNTEAMVST